MKLVTPEQMRIIDRKAIDELGIPGIVLMENAAFQVAMKASEILNNRNGSQVLVIAGNGNNGGDAFAVSRHLLTMGYSVSVFSVCEADAFNGDAGINARILVNMGVEIHSLNHPGIMERFQLSLISADLVIDGLFGTGLNRDIDELPLNIIRSINRASECTLSIDIPSGIDGLTGKIRGECIEADYTVTFFLPKAGMVQYPAAAYLGELTIADICIPYPLLEGFKTIELLDRSMISSIIPDRPEDSHKGSFGKVLVIAGSPEMAGAAYFSASAAYRTGSGLVRLAIPSGILSTLSAMIPEAVFTTLSDKENAAEYVDDELLASLIHDSDSVLLGPGLTQSPYAVKLVEKVISICDKPLVIDADALNILSGDIGLLRRKKGDVILTPHPAEMGRLLGRKTSEVQEDRLECARALAEEYGIVVVLKGAATVVADPIGNTAINPTGNNGMATAGAGDVLAGMIASFLGQKLTPPNSAAAGVFLHGLAGDLAVQEMGHAAMTASDILGFIGKAFMTSK